MEFKRCSGILMPISSLPGGYGIGSMGKPAHDFVDFLAKAGQTIWQILPVGPTGYADSPYQSCSAFASNPYFIDLDQLAADGLLKPEDYAKENWGTNPNYCDYALLYQKRYKVLRKAYAAFLQQRPVPGYDTPYSDDWYRFTLEKYGVTVIMVSHDIRGTLGQANRILHLSGGTQQFFGTTEEYLRSPVGQRFAKGGL